MSDVIVRQWGPNCYAAYVVGSGPYPDFIGVEYSRADAEELARNRCDTTLSGPLERLSVEEWSEQGDGPRNSTTPARLAPASPGATQ